MNPYDIVSWGDDGKRRPVLVLSSNGKEVAVFQITSQYDDKSTVIQSQYVAIDDWVQAGLLFDADNTLYDYDKVEAHALKTMFEYCGFEYAESLRAIYRGINSQVWRDYEGGTITKEDLQTVRFERFFKEIGVSHDTKDFNLRYLAELGNANDTGIKPTYEIRKLSGLSKFV